jgi:anti-anti-sigma factor
MELVTTNLKHVDLIAMTGRFDSATAPDLERALKASMDAGVFKIVLDMTNVEYFGSAAIRSLVQAYKECRRFARGDVRLACVPERIHNVLQIAGILPLIQVFDTTTIAVGSF